MSTAEGLRLRPAVKKSPLPHFLFVCLSVCLSLLLLPPRYVGVGPREVSVNTYSKGKYASVLGQVGGWTWLQNLLQVGWAVTLSDVG